LSVSKTNVVSEQHFDKLDCLSRKKPNTTTLSLEAMVPLSGNKTMKWLNMRPVEEAQYLLQTARKKGSRV